MKQLLAVPSHPERLVRRASIVATSALVCVAALVLLFRQPRLIDTWQPHGDKLGYLLAGPPAVWEAAPMPGDAPDLQRSVDRLLEGDTYWYWSRRDHTKNASDAQNMTQWLGSSNFFKFCI